MGQQPLVLQPLERLPYRRTTHAYQLGNFHFAQAGIAAEKSTKNFLLDILIGRMKLGIVFGNRHGGFRSTNVST